MLLARLEPTMCKSNANLIRAIRYPLRTCFKIQKRKKIALTSLTSLYNNNVVTVFNLCVRDTAVYNDIAHCAKVKSDPVDSRQSTDPEPQKRAECAICATL